MKKDIALNWIQTGGEIKKIIIYKIKMKYIVLDYPVKPLHCINNSMVDFYIFRIFYNIFIHNKKTLQNLSRPVLFL